MRSSWFSLNIFFGFHQQGGVLFFAAYCCLKCFYFTHLFLSLPPNIFKIKNGINNQEAAALIGAAFPEIKDQLLNTIQIKKQGDSELVLASIQQKNTSIQSVFIWACR